MELKPAYALARGDLALQTAAARFGLKRRYFDARETMRARIEKMPLDRYRQQNFLFIHVPKCGGSSIEAQIDTFHGHRSAVYFLKADPDLFGTVWKAALVRNPFDRLVSGFHYLKHHTTAPRDQAWTREVLGGIDNFSDFLRALENAAFRRRVLCWLHFLPQWFYVCDREGRVLVDHVGRLEDFDAFAEHLEGRLGTRIGGVREKASNRGDYRDYFNERTAGIVRKMYARDFEIFGYPTEPGRT